MHEEIGINIGTTLQNILQNIMMDIDIIIMERDIINQDITEVIINHGIHGNTTIETIEIIIETIDIIEMDPDTFGFCLMMEHLDLV